MSEKIWFFPHLHGPRMLMTTLGLLGDFLVIGPFRRQWLFHQTQVVSLHLGAKVTGSVFFHLINLLFM